MSCMMTARLIECEANIIHHGHADARQTDLDHCKTNQLMQMRINQMRIKHNIKSRRFAGDKPLLGTQIQPILWAKLDAGEATMPRFAQTRKERARALERQTDAAQAQQDSLQAKRARSPRTVAELQDAAAVASALRKASIEASNIMCIMCIAWQCVSSQSFVLTAKDPWEQGLSALLQNAKAPTCRQAVAVARFA